MRRLLLATLLLPVLLACKTERFKAQIEGNLEGANGGTLVLKQLLLNTMNIIDTIKVSSDGKFKYTLTKKGDTPEFYYLFRGERQLISMILSPGDKVIVQSDTLGKNITIEGSQETHLLNLLERRLSVAQYRFDSLALLMNTAIETGDKKRETELNFQMGSLYVKQKQEAIKHIYTNPASITNIMLLYHKFSREIPLFGDVRDVLIFRRVYDTLQTIYPNSIYLNRLLDEINSREKVEALNSKILDASESGFPDISLPDTKAVQRKLSDLSGKVILLSFWSVNDPNQRMLNRDYVELYEKFAGRGFEIYQVAVDIDKTAWARAVAEQQLPWVSVCDGLGANSVALTTYNIQRVPSNYLIDRSGTIVARDLFDKQLEDKIASMLK